ncbi:uncharacterized protein [Diadema antillarum]|uniref:uncharacterized protein n=1 Tax=Diadema antillarum TaxID=105358 RepID=UPI003A879B27
MASSTGRSDALKGKVVVITGASSGIGVGIAKEVARAGASVCLAARREDKLAEVKESLDQDGGHKTIIVKTDVTVRQQVKDLIKTAEEQLGPVDVLVNNAGIGYMELMKNLHEDNWERTVDINCKGVLNGIGAVLPGMMARKKGHIVNISSDAGRVAFPGLAVYTGTKFFVEGVSRSLRMEVKDHGIRITCIQPGDVTSNFGADSVDEEAAEIFKDVDPNKYLKPEDVGRAVVYAVSQPQWVGINEILIEPTQLPNV